MWAFPRFLIEQDFIDECILKRKIKYRSGFLLHPKEFFFTF